MPRVKTGVVRRRRHKKVLKATKGYYGTRSKLFKRANEAYIKAGEHAFAGRKLKKRDMKKLWIMRINAALKEYEMSYSVFINKLTKSKVEIDRKVISDLAINNPSAFKAIIDKVNSN